MSLRKIQSEGVPSDPNSDNYRMNNLILDGQLSYSGIVNNPILSFPSVTLYSSDGFAANQTASINFYKVGNQVTMVIFIPEIQSATTNVGGDAYQLQFAITPSPAKGIQITASQMALIYPAFLELPYTTTITFLVTSTTYAVNAILTVTNGTSNGNPIINIFIGGPEGTALQTKSGSEFGPLGAMVITYPSQN